MLQQNVNGNAIMPLLMGFTPQTCIQEGIFDEKYIYDDSTQTTMYTMPTVGTKCYRKTWTKKGTGQCEDKKNEIDDTKIK